MKQKQRGTTRGAAIEQRLAALGVSDRQFHERTSIDRKTLRRAITNDPRVRVSTYNAIESAVTALEQERQPGGDQPAEDRTVSFQLNSGEVSVTVEGPIGDADELRRQVEALVNELRRGTT